MKLLVTHNRLNGAVTCHRWTAASERDAEKCRWLSHDVVGSMGEADKWIDDQREFAALVEMERSLSWTFDDDGSWESDSVMHDMGVAFQWRIVVCEDGSFDVSESAIVVCEDCSFDVSESAKECIGSRRETFQCLRNAQVWCEEREADFGD